MAEPRLTCTQLEGDASSPQVLVVGPSLGTGVEQLWGQAAKLLADRFQVVGWDLPGHGRSAPAAEAFSVEELAAAVRAVAALVVEGRPAAYAGVSLGGGVGLALAVTPGVFSHVTCVAGAAAVGTAAGWYQRADLVRRAGTSAVVAGSLERWFAPGFLSREPSTADRLVLALREVDDESYALACEALAGMDLYDRLAGAAVPVLVAPGEHDVVVPPDVAARTAAAVPDGVLEVLYGCGHLPPAEAPAAVARMLRTHLEETDRG